MARKQIPVSERNEALVRALADIVYDWSIETGERHWNGDFTRVLGYSSEELGCDQESWKSRVHPDDLQTALVELDRAAREDRVYDLGCRLGHCHATLRLG